MVIGFAAISNAQETPRFTFSAGGGFTGIVGRDTGRLDHGGNVQLNGGFNMNSFLSVTGTFGGTNDGDLVAMKMKKSGKQVVLPFIDIYRFDGGQLKEEWLFFDSASLLSQLTTQ